MLSGSRDARTLKNSKKLPYTTVHEKWWVCLGHSPFSESVLKLGEI
jgi:hypothetical protein